MADEHQAGGWICGVVVPGGRWADLLDLWTGGSTIGVDLHAHRAGTGGADWIGAVGDGVAGETNERGRLSNGG